MTLPRIGPTTAVASAWLVGAAAAALALSACSGAASTPTSVAVASAAGSAVSAAAGEQSPNGSPGAAPAASGDVATLVCGALKAIVADMEAVPYQPEGVIAQVSIKTLGSAPTDQYPAIIAGADQAAKANCPTEYAAVVKASGKASLSAMYGG